MYTKLSASRAYTYAVARACDAGNVSRQVSGVLVFGRLKNRADRQDCAGSILYSSDRAVEVSMEAQQCLVSGTYTSRVLQLIFRVEMATLMVRTIID